MCYTGRNDASIRSSQEQSDPRLRRRQYATYAAGVEGTIAQSVRTGQVRQARYLGQAKTHLQPLMTAAIMNVMRLLRWLAEEPKAKTPRSAFARLYQAAT